MRRLSPSISLKFTYLADVRPQVRDSIDKLASAVGDKFDWAAPVTDELLRIGSKLLVRNLAQRGYLTKEEQQQTLDSECLTETLLNSAERILAGVESKMELKTKPSDSPKTGCSESVRPSTRSSPTPNARSNTVLPKLGGRSILIIRILGYSAPTFAKTRPWMWPKPSRSSTKTYTTASFRQRATGQ